MKFFRAPRCAVVVALAWSALAQGCLSPCDIVAGWRNNATTGCLSCEVTNCGEQQRQFAAVLLPGTCNAEDTSCFLACRNRDPNPDAPSTQCRCLGQCATGECRRRVDAYYSCKVANCAARCE